ncbi:MAG: hypothetical protein WAW80_01255 [Candidatus Saccharimonadales bacterium]
MLVIRHHFSYKLLIFWVVFTILLFIGIGLMARKVITELQPSEIKTTYKQLSSGPSAADKAIKKVFNGKNANPSPPKAQTTTLTQP